MCKSARCGGFIKVYHNLESTQGSLFAQAFVDDYWRSHFCLCNTVQAASARVQASYRCVYGPTSPRSSRQVHAQS